jgi:DNA-binding transcriptional regulator/RsmH inhibitor MraZ
VEDQPKPTPVEPPRGSFTAHVDEKGRLKLPVPFQDHLGAIGDDRLYATSVDDRTARVYPISAWKVNEKVLAELAKADPEASDSLFFIANDYGAEAKMDPQGRVTLPTDLRRALALENAEVRLDWSQDGINIYSMSEYEARRRRAKENLAEKLKAAKQIGFK